ncbi:dihydroorotase [Butyrivibrio proteoclasticus]|uniref:dihydroorotase n=1 Tax=Butyrivibrio proteoclasticus TaxID=43305 RepID=UPI000478D4E6|nr:dihydroorotase [Butyrivibrio proteoclasticus]
MLLIKNARIIDPETANDQKYDLIIGESLIEKIIPSDSSDREDDSSFDEIIDAEGKFVAPGLVDCHVHFRDPGFTYKEDIETGAKAAARGGFTTVVMMGNTEPHMDNAATIKDVIAKGKETGIRVYACGNVTKDMKGQILCDMDELIGAGAVLFTDDGKPITDADLMERACVEAAKRNKVISLHEENPEFIKDNGINAGEVAERLGLEGSPREAEISMVKRDIDIAEKTGASIVVQHISAAESVELIRQARKRGVKVHAEATPHHFTLTEKDVLRYGALAKMNPPLRLESDRMAIIEGLKDGTIEMIATDHAPHSKEEKAKGIKDAPSGITGLETSLALGIRELVKPGHLTLEQLIKAMTIGPASVYGLDAGRIKEGGSADLVVFDENGEWDFVNSYSKSTNTPFLGQRFPGKIYATICQSKIVYQDK